jgi:hypothetical protein
MDTFQTAPNCNLICDTSELINLSATEGFDG